LGHLLAGASVVEEEGRLTVSVPNGSTFAQDQLRDRANRQLLLEAARRVLPTVRDVVVAADAPGGAAVAGHPTVQAAVDLFNGEVTAVRPAPPGSGEAT